VPQKRCASSWVFDLSFIYEIVRFFSTPKRAIVGATSTVRKLTA
jgi:hypothetical protein